MCVWRVEGFGCKVCVCEVMEGGSGERPPTGLVGGQLGARLIGREAAGADASRFRDWSGRGLWTRRAVTPHPLRQSAGDASSTARRRLWGKLDLVSSGRLAARVEALRHSHWFAGSNSPAV
ncbi:hypothetical protein E2C01_091783 [Portunus trituberculatus]|uniref:Uncharacterized protein n=1 Tax=Portunus trituberculatus TaxID=210409 RepID=A0A5B7JEV2_PORTR|nr:hypothetical protein [Portunus trituberculatus]